LANTFPPFPSELLFGSFLAYPNRGAAEQAADQKSALACRNLVLAIKKDEVSAAARPRTLIQVWVEHLATKARQAPLADLFDRSATLIPMPRSSPSLPRSVWPALRIADAMVAEGLGADVVPCLQRIKAVPKSAFAGPGERPTALDHYNSLSVGLLPGAPSRVILVDDVVTQGATFAGAYARLQEVLADTNIIAVFSFARTVQSYSQAVEPTVGRITCRPDGTHCSRTP
jgi:phosphoribosylpyrophosphate synthetase